MGAEGVYAADGHQFQRSTFLKMYRRSEKTSSVPNTARNLRNTYNFYFHGQTPTFPICKSCLRSSYGVGKIDQIGHPRGACFILSFLAFSTLLTVLLLRIPS